MRVYTIDQIIKETLLDKGYSMHFYFRFFNHAQRCIRELEMDTMGKIEAEVFKADQFNSIALPSDVTDVVRVGIRNGIYIQPLVNNENMNITENLDANGNQIAYPSYNSDLQTDSMLYYTLYTQGNLYVNDKGEHIGRRFNHKAQPLYDYKYIREENRIALDPAMAEGTEIYVETLVEREVGHPWLLAVTPYAVETIKSYILWKHAESKPKMYGPRISQLHREQYYIELKKLRARLNPITKDDIVQNLRRNSNNAIKN